jgi:hypothetical protein
MIGNCYLVEMRSGEYPIMLFGSLNDIGLYCNATKDKCLNMENECKRQKAMIVDHRNKYPRYSQYKGNLDSVGYYDSSNKRAIKFRDIYPPSDVLVFAG